jgi:hypothetical protein
VVAVGAVVLNSGNKGDVNRHGLFFLRLRVKKRREPPE